MKRILVALVTLAAFSSSVIAQNYDSTGSNRLFVPTPSQPIPEKVPVPGYGNAPEGAVVAIYSSKTGAVTTFYACVVKAGASGGRPPITNGTVCPTNTIPMVTASGVYHDGGGNDGG
jgi:hypothetical protein